MDSTLKHGVLTELECQRSFINLGCSISVPICNFERYDFIADVDGHLIRVQCKSAIKAKDSDAIYISCRTQTINTNGISRRTYSKKEIDYFATFWDGKCYLIPVEDCSTVKYIRFTPPNNNQWSQITWGPDYELEKVLHCIRTGSKISKTIKM